MATQGTAKVKVKHGPRTVLVKHIDRGPKKLPEKPHKAGGWHIRMAISGAMHVSMTQPEARHLAHVLLAYAETIPENSN